MTDDEEHADDEAADDPLEDLHRDKEEFDRERLRDALQGVVEVDHETGDPIFFERFDERENKEQFVTLLLFRAALEKLGHIDREEVPQPAAHFARDLPVSESTVQKYARELDFVERDDGYLVEGRGIAQAIAFLGGSRS